jgi:tetratricopeptide (TPR) repeat protein
LARHFQAAGLTAKAVSYLQQAGERALSLLANQEALAHCGRSLELLLTMPDTPERARAEFNSLGGLNVVLNSLRGLAAPEKGPVLARAYELARRLDDAFAVAHALHQLHWFHLNRAEHRLARHFARQLINLAGPERPGDLAVVRICLAADLLVGGDFPAARECLEAVLAVGALPFCVGHEPAARIHLAFALWYLGYADQALQLSQRDLSLAYKTEDTGVIASALSDSWATLRQLRREPHPTLEGAEQLLALTGEDKWPWLWAMGLILTGWAHAHEGQVVEGLAEMRRGLGAWRAIGMGCRVPHWLALLAEGYALAGQAEEGLGAIAEALEHVERTDERYYEAELHRLKGELLHMQRADPEELEESYHQAIAVAQRQEAKSWELRATVSLARLRREQGRTGQAREMLAAIYGWFTEGFDTPDLQEAKALLEELSALA